MANSKQQLGKVNDESLILSSSHTINNPATNPQIVTIDDSSDMNNNGWVSIDKHTLDFDDRNRIPNGQWLSDNIFVSMILLKHHDCYKQVHGFHTPQLGKEYMFRATPSPFLLVLHVRKSHWIVVSSVGCNPGIVRVYEWFL